LFQSPSRRGGGAADCTGEPRQGRRPLHRFNPLLVGGAAPPRGRPLVRRLRSRSMGFNPLLVGGAAPPKRFQLPPRAVAKFQSPSRRGAAPPLCSFVPTHRGGGSGFQSPSRRGGGAAGTSCKAQPPRSCLVSIPFSSGGRRRHGEQIEHDRKQPFRLCFNPLLVGGAAPPTSCKEERAVG